MIDVLIVGAGAAGLMTAITAKRAGAPSVLILDSKEKIGAKILMSGGTRCNLTNERVQDRDFQTEQKNILRSVLQFFPSDQAVAFFQDLGIEVVLEAGGKFFPSTHSGRTVLEALLKEISRLGIELKNGSKVTGLVFEENHFKVSGAHFSHEAHAVVLTTGGLSFPATGSDGAGYALARSFGHRMIETSPSLTPLKLADPDLKALAGVTLPARLTLRAAGQKEVEYEGSMLFTHFGLSGPVVLNLSRHWIRAKKEHPIVEACFLPGQTEEEMQNDFVGGMKNQPSRQVKEFLSAHLPNRLVDVLFKKAGVWQSTVFNQMTKENRQKLLKLLFHYPLEISGSLGYEKAEVTAGGVDLAEVHRKTLESKLRPGLFFAGEILDVDGRIGGFNFQWAWSSGTVAGLAAAKKAQNPQSS